MGQTLKVPLNACEQSLSASIYWNAKALVRPPSLRVVVLILTVVISGGCAKPPAGRPEAPPAPVTVTAAGKKTVPVRVRTIGSVKAVASVAVRPRVGGQLTEVFFKEGDYVEENQKLFTIDSRPYDAAVKLADANKSKSAAVLKGAELEMKRIASARDSGAGSATEYDAALTAAAIAKAAVEADQAALDSAKLQAAYATITSPLKGRGDQPDQPDHRNIHTARAATPRCHRVAQGGAA
jgi:multidrug efflux system membrane fusion protein